MNRFVRNSWIGILVLFILGCEKDSPEKYSLLIKGATIINPDTETEIIPESFILIDSNKIKSYGKLENLPESIVVQKEVTAFGKFVVPGLVDGFATINNQSYANAYLYKGITSLITVDGYRRGPFFGQGNPSPDLYRLESVGDTPISDEELYNRIDSLNNKGFRILLLMYGLTPEQTQMAHEKAKSLGFGTIGELGRTTYEQGIGIGIDAFVHTTRYSLDIARRSMADSVAAQPFSNDLNSPKWRYYKYLMHVQPEDPALLQHAENLAFSDSYIMPTMSLSYLDLPFATNPWDDPVSVIIDSADINRPADKITGKHSIDSIEQKAYSDLIKNETEVIEPTYYKAGAKYLSGSATDVWGTMPGISLHTELYLLTRIGLSNEEALAASTINFSKAFGWSIGKIAPDYEADILILNTNPLDDIGNLTDIDRMFSNGVEIDRDRLLNGNNE